MEFISVIAAPIGAVVVALIAILTKRTPERRNAEESLQENINLLLKRVEALETSNEKLWKDVEGLRDRVSVLWRMLETARSYIRWLEEHIFGLSGERPERPRDVEQLMRE